MNGDEAALRALVQGLQDAWNHGDATRFAEAFTEDAEFIHILGGGGSGRAALQAGHEALLRTIYAKSHVEYRVDRIKYLAPDVAVVLMRQKLVFFEAEKPLEIFCRPTLVAVREGYGWKIALLQNTKVAGQGGAAGAQTDVDAVIAARHPHPQPYRATGGAM